jgi:hypothetical protein
VRDEIDRASLYDAAQRGMHRSGRTGFGFVIHSVNNAEFWLFGKFTQRFHPILTFVANMALPVKCLNGCRRSSFGQALSISSPAPCPTFQAFW